MSCEGDDASLIGFVHCPCLKITPALKYPPHTSLLLHGKTTENMGFCHDPEIWPYSSIKSGPIFHQRNPV